MSRLFGDNLTRQLEGVASSLADYACNQLHSPFAGEHDLTSEIGQVLLRTPLPERDAKAALIMASKIVHKRATDYRQQAEMLQRMSDSPHLAALLTALKGFRLSGVLLGSDQEEDAPRPTLVASRDDEAF